MVKDENKKVINVFVHELVPKHEVLGKKEADEVLQKYHLRPYQLPYVRLSDPAVAHLEPNQETSLGFTGRAPQLANV